MVGVDTRAAAVLQARCQEDYRENAEGLVCPQTRAGVEDAGRGRAAAGSGHPIPTDLHVRALPSWTRACACFGQGSGDAQVPDSRPARASTEPRLDGGLPGVPRVMRHQSEGDPPPVLCINIVSGSAPHSASPSGCRGPQGGRDRTCTQPDADQSRREPAAGSYARAQMWKATQPHGGSARPMRTCCSLRWLFRERQALQPAATSRAPGTEETG